MSPSRGGGLAAARGAGSPCSRSRLTTRGPGSVIRSIILDRTRGLGAELQRSTGLLTLSAFVLPFIQSLADLDEPNSCHLRGNVVDCCTFTLLSLCRDESWRGDWAATLPGRSGLTAHTIAPCYPP